MNSKLRAWVVDALETVGLVAVLPFLGTLISDQSGVFHVALWKKAATAGIAAGLGALYTAVAALRQNTISPASLMPAQQPGQAEQAAPPDAGAVGIISLIGAIIAAIGAVWLILGAVHHALDTIGLILLIVGVIILWFGGGNRRGL